MINDIKKLLDRESFFYASIFYLLYKYIFYYSGPKTTYVLIGYAVLIFLYDFVKHKNIYKFNGFIFAYLMCISTLASSLIIGHRVEIQTVKGLGIFFINFFMYLPLCQEKTEKEITKMFERVLQFILYSSFFINICGVILALCGIQISLFGTQFGSIYGGRLVTVRETANETAWFAILSLLTSIYFLLKNNQWKEKDYTTFFYAFNFIVQLLTYFLSGNRSSLFGFVAGIVVCLYAYFNMKNDKRKKNILLIVSSLFIFIGICYVGIRIFLGKGSDSVRFDMYKYGIILLLQTNILFGSSFVHLYSDLISHFDNIWNNYSFKTNEEYLRQLTTDANAHNVIIQQLNTNGIIGVAILIAFILYSLRTVVSTVKNLNNNYLIKLFCIFFIIFGLVVGNISWNIISTMTCFVNLLFFFSISALLRFVNIEKEKSYV